MRERLKALHGLSIGNALHSPMCQVELMLKAMEFGQIIHGATVHSLASRVAVAEQT